MSSQLETERFTQGKAVKIVVDAAMKDLGKEFTPSSFWPSAIISEFSATFVAFSHHHRHANLPWDVDNELLKNLHQSQEDNVQVERDINLETDEHT